MSELNRPVRLDDALNDEDRPPSQRPESRGSRWPIVVTLLILAAVGGGLYWLKAKPMDTLVLEPTSPATAPVLAPAEPAIAVDEAAAQATWQKAVAGLSSAPEWSTWTRQPGILRRLISAVSSLAEGASPGAMLGFLVPEKPFSVTENEATTVISQESYARYDPLVRVAESLDPAAVARAYELLSPTIESLYRELAPPGRTFRMTIEGAAERLITVSVPTGELEVVLDGALYRFADPQLEAKSAAEKHLLRMGPENMRRLQAKLRAIEQALP